MQPMWVQTADSALTWLPLRVRYPSIAPERKAIGVPSGNSASALTAFQPPVSTNGRDAVFGVVALVTCSIPNTAAAPAAIPPAAVSSNDRRLGREGGRGRADCSPTHCLIDPCIRSRNSFDGRPAPGLAARGMAAC